MAELKYDGKIAVIAGGGALPSLIINQLQESRKDFLVLAIEDNADRMTLSNTHHYWVNINNPASIIKLLKEQNIQNLVFAGSIKRPPLLSIKLNSTIMIFLAKLGISKLRGGTDYLHRIITQFVEAQGFKVIAPEVVAAGLVTPVGVLGKFKPLQSDIRDIEIGKQVLQKLGCMDIGQSVIVENKCVLGIEAAEGTDQLIQRCKALKFEEKRLGVLVKMSKVMQERKIDLPTIGTTTIDKVAEAGFRGIALEASSSLIIDIKQVINRANEHRIFLLGI